MLCYRDIKEGEAGLDCVVRKATVGEKEHERRGKLDKGHQSQHRLEKGGWRSIKAVPGIRKEGT